MHDLRNLGYKRLTAIDPKEDNLRTAWYKAKDTWVEEGCPSHGISRDAFNRVDVELSAYLWNRVSEERAADRAAHPSAKRNLTFQGTTGEGRIIS